MEGHSGERVPVGRGQYDRVGTRWIGFDEIKPWGEGPRVKLQLARDFMVIETRLLTPPPRNLVRLDLNSCFQGNFGCHGWWVTRRAREEGGFALVYFRF